MKKTIPREKQKHVVLFKAAQGTIAATKNIAAHFNKAIEDGDTPNAAQLRIDLDKEDPIWKDIHSRMEKGLTAKAHVAVVLPVDRLREVLKAIETPLIKLEFLPALLPADDKQTDLVCGKQYLQSMRHVGGVDALRITEITSPANHDKAGDSVCIMGVLRVVTKWFTDEVKMGRERLKRKELAKIFRARAKGQ